MDPSILYPVVKDAVRAILPSEGDPLARSLNGVFEEAVDDFIRGNPELGPVNESFLARQENLKTILRRYLTYESPMPTADDLNLAGYADNPAVPEDAGRFLAFLESKIRAVPSLERILAMKRFISDVRPHRRPVAPETTSETRGTPLPPPGASCQEWMRKELIDAGFRAVELLHLNPETYFDSDPARERVFPDELGGAWEYLRYLSPVSAVVSRGGFEAQPVRPLFTVLQRDLTAPTFKDLYDAFRVDSFQLNLVRSVRSRNLPETALNTLVGKRLPAIGVCIVAGRVEARRYAPLARYRYETMTRGQGSDRLVLHYFPEDREAELRAVAASGSPVSNTNPILFVASKQNQESVRSRIALVSDFITTGLPADIRFSFEED